MEIIIFSKVLAKSVGMTWYQCQQGCEDEGGNLTSIHLDEENQFIFGNMFISLKLIYYIF